MKSDKEINAAVDMIDNRLERDTEVEHPLRDVVLAFHQAKRAGLLLVLNSERGEFWQTVDGLEDSFAEDMSLPQYVQHQAMYNAIMWTQNEMEDI
jgi:hypothetical protein